MDTCGDCLYWDNADDPRESCKLSLGSSVGDEACGYYVCGLGEGNRQVENKSGK